MDSATLYIGGSIFAVLDHSRTPTTEWSPFLHPASAGAGRWQLQMRSIVSVIWMIKYLFSVPAAGHTTLSAHTFTNFFMTSNITLI